MNKIPLFLNSDSDVDKFSEVILTLINFQKEVRRYLTIGYPGEVRSPLRERQNLAAVNVKRSNSDQTPLKKRQPPVTRSQVQKKEVEF